MFATDAVLAHLMASPRSALPWDIVVTVLPGGIIFLDARDPLEFELHTVNETAHAQPPDVVATESGGLEANTRVPLSIEASTIYSNFTQQVRAWGAWRGTEG